MQFCTFNSSDIHYNAFKCALNEYNAKDALTQNMKANI